MRYLALVMMLAIAAITSASGIPTAFAYDASTSRWRDGTMVADLRVDASDLRDTNQLTRSDWLTGLTDAVQVWDDAADAEHLPVHLRVVDGDQDADIYIQ